MTGHGSCEIQRNGAGLEGRAEVEAATMHRALAPHTISDGHLRHDAQLKIAVGTGRANARAEPMDAAPAPTYSQPAGHDKSGHRKPIAGREGRANGAAKPKECSPAPHFSTDPGSDAGADQTMERAVPSIRTSDPHQPPQGARAARPSAESNAPAPRAIPSVRLGADGESEAREQPSPRARAPRSQPIAGPEREGAPGAGGEGRATSATKPMARTPAPHSNSDGQPKDDTHSLIAVGAEGSSSNAAPDLRFADPLVQEIVETWRLRQDFVRAHTRLTLQIRAICRRLCAGDKAEADRVYTSMLNGRDHPLAETAWLATMPLVSAREPIEDGRKRLEKQLAKLAQKLPTAPFAAETRGFGFSSLAATYGECGDVAAYRTVAGLWKRAGLAVIDGERQRKVAGDAALLHGYSPSRRSVFWNISALQIKTNGAYRPLYDERKEYRLAQGWTKGHAHNDAGRYVCKRLLRDLWVAARRAQGEQP